jgi:hypothetical protein
VTLALDAERFRREIATAARLQHPHICSVYDSGETDGQLWYTMPYIRGESLRERLRGGGRPGARGPDRPPLARRSLVGGERVPPAPPLRRGAPRAGPRARPPAGEHEPGLLPRPAGRGGR